MVYIPKNAQWYWAEIIEEITVQGELRNVVHRNIVLVNASSPTGAYDKAIEIGQRSETLYENPEGATVKTRFRGLGSLDVIHDKLEHGAELMYREDVGVSEKEIKKWVCPKARLPLFREENRRDLKPDYSSKEIVNEVRRLLDRESLASGRKQSRTKPA